MPEKAREPEIRRHPSSGRNNRQPHSGRQRFGASPRARSRSGAFRSARPHGPRERRPGARGVKAVTLDEHFVRDAPAGRAASEAGRERRRGRGPCAGRARGA